MTADMGTDWPEEMSIADRMPPYFFGSRGQIDAAAGRVPQAHALRRAFDGLAFDGIVCRSNTPFLYFKEVPRHRPREVGEPFSGGSGTKAWLPSSSSSHRARSTSTRD